MLWLPAIPLIPCSYSWVLPLVYLEVSYQCEVPWICSHVYSLKYSRRRTYRKFACNILSQNQTKTNKSGVPTISCGRLHKSFQMKSFCELIRRTNRRLVAWCTRFVSLWVSSFGYFPLLRFPSQRDGCVSSGRFYNSMSCCRSIALMI